MSLPSSRLRPLYESAGARWIELPVLHPADPFLETAGEDIRKRMFVTEGPQGERLALRPDFTIPVCIEHLRTGAAATRYAYEGLAFRRHDQGAPERTETGSEDIGRSDRVAADTDALALAVACAAEVTDAPLTVRLGDIGVFAALLRALGLPGRWRRRLRRSFGVPVVMQANLERMVAPPDVDVQRLDAEQRAAAAHGHDGLVALIAERRTVHGYSEGVGRAPREIAERFFEQRALPDAAAAKRARDLIGEYLTLGAELAAAPDVLRAFATKNALELDAALDLFEERATTIATRAPAAAIRFEARFGRPLDYYTGLVFEISAAGASVPLAGGGRYDRLMEMLGAKEPIPAVGFTMRLDASAAKDSAA